MRSARHAKAAQIERARDRVEAPTARQLFLAKLLDEVLLEAARGNHGLDDRDGDDRVEQNHQPTADFRVLLKHDRADHEQQGHGQQEFADARAGIDDVADEALLRAPVLDGHVLFVAAHERLLLLGAGLALGSAALLGIGLHVQDQGPLVGGLLILALRSGRALGSRLRGGSAGLGRSHLVVLHGVLA